MVALGPSCSGGPTTPSPTVTVSSVSPVSGTTFGGTPVTISGRSFQAGASVVIGGALATSVIVVDPTTITATTAPRAAGTADVVVSVGGQSGRLANGYTYVAPGPTTNTPPVITSLTAQGTRPRQPPAFADLNETIRVTAAVQDAETAAGNLTYEWTAASGTFTGSGASVEWRAPQVFTTPGTVLLSVTVIERYVQPGPTGLPVQQEHRVSGAVTVKVHDSAREVGEMARKFLLLFSDSSVPPETVVQDFLPGCGADGRGRENELNDVIFNRANFVITASRIDDPRVTVNFGGQCTLFPERFRPSDACALVTVQWTNRHIPTGQVSTVNGTDQVTAIYNGTRWGLCDSDFQGTAITASGVRLPGSFFKR